MQLIAVTNDQMSNDKLVDTLLEFEPFIDLVILREKSKTAIEVLDLIGQLTTLGFDCTKIIVHGRADIASLTSVNKVQLPGHGLPLSSALHHFPSISFGKSIHSFDEAKEAYVNGASWLLYGHLFQTASKIGLPHRGTKELFRITKSFPIPVYAIGGIHPQHLQQLHENGVEGVAIMSSIFGSDNVLESVKSYANMILLKNGGVSLEEND